MTIQQISEMLVYDGKMEDENSVQYYFCAEDFDNANEVFQELFDQDLEEFVREDSAFDDYEISDIFLIVDPDSDDLEICPLLESEDETIEGTHEVLDDQVELVKLLIERAVEEDDE